MKYLEWNNIISEFFFNSANAGKDIHLYLTRRDIIGIASFYFKEETEDEIWADFVGKIKFGLPGASGNIIARAKHSYEKRNFKSIDSIEIKYPPYISYLVFLVLPLIEDSVECINQRASNYYGRLNDFLIRNRINERIGTNDFSNNQINSLWEDLANWANVKNNGDFGLFKAIPFSNPNWIYVGKVFSQCVLPPKFINRLSVLFESIGLVPNTIYDDNFLQQKIIKSKTSLIPENTIDLLKKDDELSKSIIQIIQYQYQRWTGETHQEVEDATLQRKIRNHTLAPLFLQFKVNTNDERIKFSYRMYSQNDYPEDLKFGEHENLYEINGWSKTLPFEFKEGLELKDSFNRWIAKLPERDVRLFVSAATIQLSSDFWIETDVLSKTERMYLLCKNTKKETIKEWGTTFTNNNFKQEDFDGLPENYSLFWFRNPSQSHSEISLLTLYTEKRIELISGLMVNFRTFINDFLPEVEIINSDGNESVYLQYKNTDHKILLNRKSSINNRWLLPADISLNTDFYIKVDGESFSSNDLAYCVISTDNAAINVDGSQLPKRDSFGKQITENLTQYCIGSEVVNPNTTREVLYKHLFRSTKEDVAAKITNPIFNNHYGNKLCSFLSLKSVLTTEEFFKAFEFYYSKEFSENQDGLNFNLTKLKRASLNFYDFTGILDYNYETKKIVVNPAQFIFIPATKGRKVLLIGARDATLIETIINTAPNYNLQVETTKHFSSNKRLLLPDVITIKAFGTSGENYGEKDLKNFADSLRIKITTNYLPQIDLQNFSASIEEYESTLLQTDENDYDWARYIFNPENLVFEKNQELSFDKSFSLVKYKLNEYTYYYKLWKDNKCFQIDMNWGRFVALKHINKAVILFESANNKVAIPVETPLPRLLSESIMLLSGLAPYYKEYEGRKYRIFENVPSIFTQNLFRKLGQTPINRAL